MPISLTGHAVGQPERVIAVLRQHGAQRDDQLVRYVRELYRLAPLAGINPDAAVAQFSEETGFGTSAAWADRLNFAGWGITDGGDQGLSLPDGETAARVHLVHLAAYIFGTCPPALAPYKDLDVRWQNVANAGWLGVARTTADLTGRWATDGREPNDPLTYDEKIDQHYRVLIGNVPPTDGATAMTFTTDIPGLPGGPLETSFPVHIKLCPEWRTLNRPGIKAQTPRRSIQHGNGNPHSTAAGEANFLFNGCPDDSGDPQQTSYHSSIDDQECWVMIPVDEVAWQAADGAGPGNMCGFSCEQVEDDDLWADPDRRQRVIANAAEWMGKISARLGIDHPQQHWDFNFNDPDRHDCPDKLRHTVGAWAAYAAAWSANKAIELAKMNGQAPSQTGPAPVHWVSPEPIAGLPDYNTMDPNTAEALVTVDGTDFLFVSDVVEALEDIPRRKRASYAQSAEINMPIKKGERFVVVWLFKSKTEGDQWYLTPWNTRVPRAKTRRISDAPLNVTRTAAPVV